jgi:hypothetical protein
MSMINQPLHQLLMQRTRIFGARIGQLFISFVVFCISIGIFIYFLEGHGWQQDEITMRGYIERSARSMGQLANVLIAIVLLTQSKNGIWTIVFGKCVIMCYRVITYVIIRDCFTLKIIMNVSIGRR